MRVGDNSSFCIPLEIEAQSENLGIFRFMFDCKPMVGNKKNLKLF